MESHLQISVACTRGRIGFWSIPSERLFSDLALEEVPKSKSYLTWNMQPNLEHIKISIKIGSYSTVLNFPAAGKNHFFMQKLS